MAITILNTALSIIVGIYAILLIIGIFYIFAHPYGISDNSAKHPDPRPYKRYKPKIGNTWNPHTRIYKKGAGILIINTINRERFAETVVFDENMEIIASSVYFAYSDEAHDNTVRAYLKKGWYVID
jgi:hypothetical protein